MDVSFYHLERISPAQLRRGHTVLWCDRTATSVLGTPAQTAGGWLVRTVAGDATVPFGRRLRLIRPRNLITDPPTRS